MDLKTELEKRADFFNGILEKFLSKGEPETLYDAVRHLPLAGGKRLRPSLAMISCESVSGDIKNVMPLAIALELTHNFTLVHDDIMDKSKLRRNMPTVHVKFGEATAIIAGDLLFSKAFEAMHDIQGDPSIFKNVEFGLIDCVRLISEGQQLDIEFENRKNVAEDEYLDMILKKTAVMFMYAAEAGAILGGGSREQANALNEYGKSLGLGFQIHDDYLDMSSNEETLGKDIGNDIRNGKKTLIAVHCLNNASGKDKKLLNKLFGNLNASDNEVKQVYNLFKSVGSIEYAKKTAIQHCEIAKKSLDILPDSDAKKILLELADYSIKREK
ncbi:MAG: polyprenyl synthetase family protein [Thermoplasmatales archaeon]|nr:polyprenyl synthetase family protein [Thermoplasmatales archaeon]